MKIVDVMTRKIHYRSNVVRDTEGHGHPGPEHDAVQTMVTIVTDEGLTGDAFGGDQAVIDGLVRPLLLGKDPFYREQIWQMLRERQRLHLGRLADSVLCAIDLCLWDLAGKHANLPVYKLLGATRDKVPAYASTMCGDIIPGGLDTPEAYAEFALKCMERGYPAFKLHTWQPPVPGAPDPKRDIAACAAVREAVGPNAPLMLDPFHYYNREQALYLGRELEKLGFYWLEEPMAEHSISSYVWLTNQLELAIVGPETAEGKMYTRAEWIVRGASDISRAGVGDLGGLTPLMKTVGLCESHGVRLEIHGGGPGNLHALCAMSIPGEYYERGLLHPHIDYETPTPWLRAITDPMDDEGFVHVSQQPGLGMDVNWDYIGDNLV
jgi:L-alanine-DL-glutamate epimerase-like enolase superfamily enzyme